MFKRLLAAMLKQKRQIAYCPSSYSSAIVAEELAARLLASTNYHMAQATFFSTDREAVHAAIEMSRQYRLRRHAHKPRYQCLHVVLKQDRWMIMISNLSKDYVSTSKYGEDRQNNQSLHDRESSGPPDNMLSIVDASIDLLCLETELNVGFESIGYSNVVAVITEPLMGSGAEFPAQEPRFFQLLRQLCDRFDVLLIFDETRCGCGRTGPRPTAEFPKPLHAWQDPAVDIKQDIMVMGAALSGGYQPVATVLAWEKVISTLQGDYGGVEESQILRSHPVAYKAALELLKIINEEDLVTNALEKGALLGRLLHKGLADDLNVDAIMGKGLYWRISFVEESVTRTALHSVESIAASLCRRGEISRKTIQSVSDRLNDLMFCT
jgi:adenosylmethionine-8-amino-7-oxononanoate aminotransferase